MDIITFEKVTEDTLYIAQEMVNSNPEYNLLEHNKETRTLADVRVEFLNGQTKSRFIKLDDTYIGLIDYMEKNPKDHFPWLGLLMIHGDYQGYGFGSQGYFRFEQELVNKKHTVLKVGILKGNKKAQTFWEEKGFVFLKTIIDERSKEIHIYEKTLVQSKANF